MRRLLVLAVCWLIALGGSAQAQRGAAGGFHAGSFGAAGGFHTGSFGGARGFRHGSVGGRFAAGQAFPFGPFGPFGGFPWWGGYAGVPFYGDVMDDGPAAPPPVVVIENDRSPEAPRARSAAALLPAAPKMIEVPDSAAEVSRPRTPSIPAVLVLSNGQRIEVRRYTIVGNYLYDSSRPRQTSKIPLQELNLEATIEANAARGIPFELPADSNQVEVRF